MVDALPWPVTNKLRTVWAWAATIDWLRVAWYTFVVLVGAASMAWLAFQRRNGF